MQPPLSRPRRALAAALLLLAVPIAFADAATDSALQESIQSRLNAELDPPDYVEVTVKDGVVSLVGEVAGEDTRTRVGRLVTDTDGVTGIVDEVSVSGHGNAD